MTVANEGWIQDSLARLEELEERKAQLEASGQSDGLAEIESEIRALYEALEAVADDGEEAAQDQAAPANDAPSPFEAPVSSQADESPFAAPAQTDESPFAAAAEAPMSMAPPGAMSEVYGGDDVDVKPPRSATPFILLGLLLVAGLGAGGWYMTQQQKKEAEKPAPAPTEATVIQAGAIPDDTQEPDAAQGVDADRTQGTRFKESNRQPERRASSGPRPRSRGDSKKKSDHKIVTDNSNDPLSGVK